MLLVPAGWGWHGGGDPTDHLDVPGLAAALKEKGQPVLILGEVLPEVSRAGYGSKGTDF